MDGSGPMPLILEMIRTVRNSTILGAILTEALAVNTIISESYVRYAEFADMP